MEINRIYPVEREMLKMQAREGVIGGVPLTGEQEQMGS